MKWLKMIVLSAVLMSLFNANAMASEVVLAGDVANVPAVVGLGIGVVPDYLGSDDYKPVPLPFLKYTFMGERYIKLAGPELTVNVLNSSSFYLGPLVRYYGSRDDDVDDNVVKKMKEIDAGLSAGAFLAYEIKGAEPRNRVNFTLKFLADVSDNYDGYMADFDVTLWRKVAEKWDWFIGAGTTYADGDYMDTYFSVNNGNRGSATPAQLSNYNADGGMRDVRIQTGAIWNFAQHWLVGGLVRYQILLGDAKDSPVVDDRGDSNQMAAALFVGYKW